LLRRFAQLVADGQVTQLKVRLCRKIRLCQGDLVNSLLAAGNRVARVAFGHCLLETGFLGARF